MRDVKLNTIVEKVNKWLSFRNYKLTIETKENGYLLKLFQGTHQFKLSAYQKDRFDSRYARYIKDFTMDALTRDFYNCVFGSVITVRLDIIPLQEHPSEYLARHKYNIIDVEPVSMGDCWIITMVDEGLPLTDLMTKL